MAIVHHPGCRPDYPEKLAGEAPRAVTRSQVDGEFWVDTCVDCGAFETNLPPEDDPYWDEAKADLKAMGV